MCAGFLSPHYCKMSSWLLLTLGLVAVSAASAGTQQHLYDSPTVQIAQGVLRGAADQTADGTRYYKFLGIPYAKPPLGKLRFAAPQSPEPWSGVRDATKFGQHCVQVSGGSEDCLFLNVYTPELPTGGNGTRSLLPVFVYIHGGAFLSRSGDISPGQLLNYDIVVVTINYRLNVFGFLSVNGTDAPGNAGLKDQSAALRWVQKNIAQFGGNPNSITINGNSAGGASVHFHVLSPMSRGLFHRAIAESGSALNPWAFVRNTEVRGYRLAARLHKQASNGTELVEFLRAAEASDLVKYLGMLLTADEKVRILSNAFVPSLEFPRRGEEPFLAHEPSYIERHGLFDHVPLVMGSAAREGSSFVTQKKLTEDSYWQGINKDLEQVVPLDLGLAQGSQESREVAQLVKSFYFGNQSISYETRESWLDLQTDLLIATGVTQTVHYHARHSAARSTYQYQVSHGSAGHCAEYKYLVYDGRMEGQSSDDVKMARLVGETWTSFTKTGVPSVTDGSVTWEPVTPQGSYPYLDLTVPPALRQDMEKKRMDFWFNIYNKYGNYTSVL